MKKVSDLLAKFQNLEHPDHKKELLSKFISAELGLSLTKNQLDFRNKTLFIKADSYIKGEVYLKKDSLLKKIAESFPNIKINDIR